MLLFIASLALAGDLVLQATVPVSVHVDGQIAAQIFTEAEIRLPVSVGSHTVTVYRNGNPEQLDVAIRDGLDSTLTIGRTGVTAGEALERMAPVDGPIAVEFRVAKGEGVMLILDGDRHALSSEQVFKTELPGGSTPISVRSASGTVIWSTGSLALTYGPIVVQLTPGRLPEVPSLGGSFEPKL